MRMDLMRAQGITDESGFTFFEIAQGPQGNAALGERYFEAFSPTSAPARSAGLHDNIRCSVRGKHVYKIQNDTLYYA